MNRRGFIGTLGVLWTGLVINPLASIGVVSPKRKICINGVHRNEIVTGSHNGCYFDWAKLDLSNSPADEQIVIQYCTFHGYYDSPQNPYREPLRSNPHFHPDNHNAAVFDYEHDGFVLTPADEASALASHQARRSRPQ